MWGSIQSKQSKEEDSLIVKQNYPIIHWQLQFFFLLNQNIFHLWNLINAVSSRFDLFHILSPSNLSFSFTSISKAAHPCLMYTKHGEASLNIRIFCCSTETTIDRYAQFNAFDINNIIT